MKEGKSKMRIWRKNRTQYAQLFSCNRKIRFGFMIGQYMNTEIWECLDGNQMAIDKIGKGEILKEYTIEETHNYITKKYADGSIESTPKQRI